MQTACKFRFGFWDVTAAGDAKPTVNDNQAFADIADVNNEGEVPELPNVATLEHNFGWVLDGSREVLPDDAAAYPWGWWSESISGDDCSFVDPPQLVVDFMDDSGAATPHSSAGITLDFVGTLPRLVQIEWYGADGGLLASGEFAPDSMTYFCEQQVFDYCRVVITVPAMRWPGRYLRVIGVLFGCIKVLGGGEVISARLTQEIDPAGLTLPVGKLDLSFYSPDGEFDLLDPAGAYQLFQYRQRIEVYKSIDGEQQQVAECYLQEASGTVDAATELVCQDIIGVLDGVEYDGGIYEDKPVLELLDEILTPEGVDFTIDAAFAGVTLSGWLPIGSKRAALQNIAFAIGAMVLTCGGGGVRFVPLPTVCAADIGVSRKIVGHKVKLGELVTQVDVTAHRYELGDSGQLAKSTLGVGEHKITFIRPAEVSGVRGATLLEAHPNFCRVQVDAAGEVTVNGREWENMETVYSAALPSIPAGCSPGVKSVSNATLVDGTRAQAAAERLLAYYQMRYTDEGQSLPGWETVGDMAAIHSLNGRTIEGYIERLVTDLSGGALQTVEIRGGVK